MILPTRGKYLCEVISRTKKLESGLYLSDRMEEDREDNMARVIGVGDPIKGKKGKTIPMLARRTDIIHYKRGFGSKFKYEDKEYTSVKNGDVIAIEREGTILAPGSMVIVKLEYADKMSTIIVPDSAKQYHGDFDGRVIAIGPEFVDKDLKIEDKLSFLRHEGYTWKSYADRTEYLSVQSKWCYGKETT